MSPIVTVIKGPYPVGRFAVGRPQSADSCVLRILNMFNWGSRLTITESAVYSADSTPESADYTTDSAKICLWVRALRQEASLTLSAVMTVSWCFLTASCENSEVANRHMLSRARYLERERNDIDKGVFSYLFLNTELRLVLF